MTKTTKLNYIEISLVTHILPRVADEECCCPLLFNVQCSVFSCSCVHVFMCSGVHVFLTVDDGHFFPLHPEEHNSESSENFSASPERLQINHLILNLIQLIYNTNCFESNQVIYLNTKKDIKGTVCKSLVFHAGKITLFGPDMH